jgi:hypothetical protein
MKNRITPEQLQELTEKQKNRLREWWKPQEGDFALYAGSSKWYSGEYLITSVSEDGWLCYEDDHRFGRKEDCLPALSIAQMIEILEEKDQCLNIVKRTDLEGWGYEIQLRRIDYYQFSTDELCDALWEAVKKIL